MAGVSGFLGALGPIGGVSFCFEGMDINEMADDVDASTSCDIGVDPINGGTFLYENGFVGKRWVEVSGRMNFDPVGGGITFGTADPVPIGLGSVVGAAVSAGYAYTIPTFQITSWKNKAEAAGKISYEFTGKSRGRYFRNA